MARTGSVNRLKSRCRACFKRAQALLCSRILRPPPHPSRLDLFAASVTTYIMELVTVFRSFSPGEAQLIRSRLEAAGFAAEVTHELSALSMDGYSMATGGVRVQVPADQAEEARALIEEPDAASE